MPSKVALATELCKVAAEALRLKADVSAARRRKQTRVDLYRRQAAAFQGQMAKVLVPFFREMISEVVTGFEWMGGEKQWTKAFCPTGPGGGVDNSCGSKKTRDYNIVIQGDSAQYEKTMEGIFGRRIPDDSMAAMGGAPDGATVKLKASPSVISVFWEMPDGRASAYRRFGVDEIARDYGAPGVYCENLSFGVHPEFRGKGFGVDSFVRQVEECAANGVEHIETMAIGKKGDDANGYYTWARFGYDAPLEIKHRFGGAKYVSDLMKTAEGREWWKENGSSFSGRFDLKEGSLSRKVLDAYVAEKRSRAAAGTKSGGRGNSGQGVGGRRAFCPTGEGGGVDNSCSPNRGKGITDTPEFKAWFGSSKIVDDKGSPLVVYHGTDADFDEFRTERTSGKTSDPNAFVGSHFTASSNTASKFATELYDTNGEGGRVIPVYLSIKNPLMIGKGRPDAQELADLEKKYEEAKSAMDKHAVDRLNDESITEKFREAIESDDEDAITAAMHDPEGDKLYQEQQSSLGAIQELKEQNRPIKESEIYEYAGIDYEETASQLSMLSGKSRVGFAKRIGKKIRVALIEKGYDGVFYENAYEEETGVGVGDDNRRSFIAFHPEQIKSAIGNSGKFDPNDPNITKSVKSHSDSAANLVSQVFATRKWKQRLVDVTLPILARGMGGAAVSEVMLLGAESRVKWKGAKAFCPTGEGGGVDNSCGPKGGSASSDPLTIAPMAVGQMALEQSKEVQRKLHERYESDADFRDAVHLLKEQTVTDTRANVVQAIVAAVAAGKDPNQDKRVLKAVDKDESFSRDRIDEYAKSAKGYLATMEKAPAADYPIYRGQKPRQYSPGDNIEFGVPSSSTQSRDVAAHYSGGQIVVIGKGAKALPVDLMAGASGGPESGVYAHKKSRVGYERQPAYFNASMGTDEEVMTMGKFRVDSIKRETISYEDQNTGKRKTKEFEVVYASPSSKTKSFTKATTASQWLQMTGITAPPGVKTEWPPWLIKKIEEQLAEAYDQDYWGEIVDETTRDDIEAVVARGLRDGHSIRDIAADIKESLGEEYYKNRALTIARTETLSSLNGGRKAGIEALQDELGPQVQLRAIWMSMLLETTRDAHANLDGVPADEDGMWDLNGVRVPYPGHWSLPASDRCNCYCGITSEFGYSSEDASAAIQAYNERVARYEAGEGEFADDYEGDFEDAKTVGAK